MTASCFSSKLVSGRQPTDPRVEKGLHKSPQGTFNLHVPQRVGDGVPSGAQHRVERCGPLASLRATAGGRADTGAEHCGVAHGDRQEVGGAGREGPPPPCRRAHAQVLVTGQP